MIGTDKQFFRKLTVQIVLIVSLISIVLAVGFYTFLLRPVTGFMKKQIELNMMELGRDIYSVCDQADMDIMRMGLPEDSPAVMVKRGYALGLIENIMFRKNVIVLISKEYEQVLKPDHVTTESFHNIFNELGARGERPPALISHDGIEYYAYMSGFDPWNWRIIILKNVEAFTALKKGIITFYSSTGLLLAAGALLLLYYFNRVIRRPLYRIISSIQMGEKPAYRGIEEFEYLSVNLKNSLEKIDQNRIELEKVNESLKKEIQERMIIAENLKISEQKYRSIVENTLVGVYKSTVDGRILYVNEALAKILEFESPEALMKTSVIARYKNPQDRQKYIDALQKKGRVDFFETEILTKKGSVLTVLICGSIEGDELSGVIVDMTQRKQAEKELAKFKFISDNAYDAHFLVDRNGRFQYVNQAACHILGYTEAELLNMSVPDVDDIYDLEALQELFDLLQKEKVSHIETVNRRKDNTIFSSEISVTGYQIEGVPYMFAALRDISQRKSDEERIKFLADIIDSSPISVIATDPEANIMYVNPATERLFGYDKSELLGKNPNMLNADPDLSASENEVLGGLSASGYWRGEMLNRRKNGELFHLSAVVSQLLNEKGEVVALVGFQEDISRRKENERALQKAKEEIESWNRELEERVKAKTEELNKSQQQLIQSEKLSAMGEMAGGLAHELNSPLAGLLPMIEKYRDATQAGTAEYSELTLMLKASRHMAKIVRDFTSFSRETKGEFVLLNLNEVIEDTLSFSLSRFKQKSINMVKNFQQDIPLVMGEKTELQQVILNIMTNALDAMTFRGTFIIRTGFSEKDNRVTMEFADTGCGISREMIGKIFDPFCTTKRPGKGTGLGLSVSYRIIKKHDGDFTVESDPGKGSTFRVSFPVPRV